MEELIKKAYTIANLEDVSSLINCAVVYSVSYMPNDDNKVLAMQYMASNKYATLLDNTPCGQALINLGLAGRVDNISQEITNIWKIASTRFINQATGNINAFVEGADKRATFYTTELALIMSNPKIITINNIKKEIWQNSFKPKHYTSI